MNELLKVGSKNPGGIATSIASDFDGFVKTTDSGRFVPRRGFDSVQNLRKEKKLLKSKYIEDEVVFLGNDEHIADGWAKNQTAENRFEIDTSVKDDGSCSVKLTTSNTSSYAPTKAYSEGIDLSGFDTLSMWAHVDNIDQIQYFNVTFECPDSSNRFYIRSSASISILNELKAIFGDGEIAFNRDQFAKTGNPDWSKFKRVYLSLQSKTSGVDASINLANVKMTKRKPKNAKIIMRFDDGLLSVYERAKPIFEEYNVYGTCFINPWFVATDDSHNLHSAYGGNLPAMNLKEIKTLHDMGWTMCSHTWKHKLYNDPTVEKTAAYPRRKYSQAYNDLAATQDWLFDNGFGEGATSHVYGNHYYNAETFQAVRDIMLIDYTVHPVYDYLATLPWSESIMHIGAERFCEKASDGTYPVIDRLIEIGGLCVPMFHRIDGDGVDGSVSAQTLEDVVNYICMHDGVDIITSADLAYATPVALR